MPRPLTIRWTIGDVSDYGFEALALAMRGAVRLFGSDAQYVVCVNTLTVAAVRQRLGFVPPNVQFRQSREEQIPPFIRRRFRNDAIRGYAWKFAPLRIAPDDYELSLDNDVILWRIPTAIEQWLDSGKGCVIAEDVIVAFGGFDAECGPEPRNIGIRGLPPGFDMAGPLERILAEHPAPLTVAIDEQGLQVAVLSREPLTRVVPLHEVTICSPIEPHLQHLGSHGAHFVGLNVKEVQWSWDDVPGAKYFQWHWESHLPTMQRLIGSEEAAAAFA